MYMYKAYIFYRNNSYCVYTYVTINRPFSVNVEFPVGAKVFETFIFSIYVHVYGHIHVNTFPKNKK